MFLSKFDGNDLLICTGAADQSAINKSIHQLSCGSKQSRGFDFPRVADIQNAAHLASRVLQRQELPSAFRDGRDLRWG